jgi:hypothetical protein
MKPERDRGRERERERRVRKWTKGEGKFKTGSIWRKREQ